jgi:hypothetical protein
MKWLIAAFVGILILLAIFIPSNTLTGHIVQEGTCKGLGCVELCSEQMTCGEGLTCCQTHWDSGVCDYETNCEVIRQYSLYQSLETYQDSVREKPSPITGDTYFIIPLAIVLLIIAYFIYQRK